MPVNATAPSHLGLHSLPLASSRLLPCERRPSAYACRAGSLIVVFILFFCLLPRIISSLGSCPSLRTVFHRAAVTPPAAHTCQVKEGFYLVCTLDAGAQNQDGKKDIILGTDGEIKQKRGTECSCCGMVSDFNHREEVQMSCFFFFLVPSCYPCLS